MYACWTSVEEFTSFDGCFLNIYWKLLATLIMLVHGLPVPVYLARQYLDTSHPYVSSEKVFFIVMFLFLFVFCI